MQSRDEYVSELVKPNIERRIHNGDKIHGSFSSDNMFDDQEQEQAREPERAALKGTG